MADEGKRVVREQTFLSEDDAEAVYRIARENGISRSATIQRLVRAGLGKPLDNIDIERRTWVAQPNVTRITDEG